MRRFGLSVLTLGLLLAIALGGLAQEKVKIGVLGKCVHPYWDVVRIGVEAAAELLPDVEATF